MCERERREEQIAARPPLPPLPPHKKKLSLPLCALAENATTTTNQPRFKMVSCSFLLSHERKGRKKKNGREDGKTSTSKLSLSLSLSLFPSSFPPQSTAAGTPSRAPPAPSPPRRPPPPPAPSTSPRSLPEPCCLPCSSLQRVVEVGGHPRGRRARLGLHRLNRPLEPVGGLLDAGTEARHGARVAAKETPSGARAGAGRRRRRFHFRRSVRFWRLALRRPSPPSWRPSSSSAASLCTIAARRALGAAALRAATRAARASTSAAARRAPRRRDRGVGRGGDDGDGRRGVEFAARRRFLRRLPRTSRPRGAST